MRILGVVSSAIGAVVDDVRCVEGWRGGNGPSCCRRREDSICSNRGIIEGGSLDRILSTIMSKSTSEFAAAPSEAFDRTMAECDGLISSVPGERVSARKLCLKFLMRVYASSKAWRSSSFLDCIRPASATCAVDGGSSELVCGWDICLLSTRICENVKTLNSAVYREKKKGENERKNPQFWLGIGWREWYDCVLVVQLKRTTTTVMMRRGRWLCSTK
jgi:hypothetical protein